MLTLQELRSSTRKELLAELQQARKAFQQNRIGVRTKHQKDTALIRKQKRHIARLLTILKELDLEQAVSAAPQI